MKPFVVALVLLVLLAPVPVRAGQAAAQPTAQAEPARPTVPFPEGAKIAFINIQRIANESSEGRAATAKVKALNDQKVAELNERQKALAANQEKLQKGGSVMSDQARTQLEREIERQQVDIQRFTQDAQAEVQELQAELQTDFQRKLLPIIDAVAQEKALHMIFSVADAGVVWAYPGLDITADVIKRFDEAMAAAAKK